MIYQEIQKKLFHHQELKYQKFVQKLIPDCSNIIGVRMGILKKMAKQLVKENQGRLYLTYQPQFHEECLLQALILGMLVKSPDDFNLISDFIPKINNWAVCDTLCTYLKEVKLYPDQVFEFVQPYLNSKKEFEMRFALVLLLFHFIKEAYLARLYKIMDNFSHSGYYASMGMAWLFSMCFIKYPDQTLLYLNNSTLEEKTFNRGIQKIIESAQISKTEHHFLKSLKKKDQSSLN